MGWSIPNHLFWGTQILKPPYRSIKDDIGWGPQDSVNRGQICVAKNGFNITNSRIHGGYFMVYKPL